MKKTGKTKNTTAFSFVVDFTKPENVMYPGLTFVETKINAGVPLTETDVFTLADFFGNTLVNDLLNSSDLNTKKEVKEPWYKRFYNWITRKK